MVMKRQAIQRRIKEISIMGGSFGLNNRKTLGNVTGFAEFNFYCDPDAARMVLNPNCIQ